MAEPPAHQAETSSACGGLVKITALAVTYCCNQLKLTSDSQCKVKGLAGFDRLHKTEGLRSAQRTVVGTVRRRVVHIAPGVISKCPVSAFVCMENWDWCQLIISYHIIDVEL